jgi:hypothetical protein
MLYFSVLVRVVRFSESPVQQSDFGRKRLHTKMRCIIALQLKSEVL